MAAAEHDWTRMPWWTWAGPLAGALVAAGKFIPGVPISHPAFITAAVAALGVTVFATVHHAEALAVKIGDPFGSILLALAITTLEVGLIISILVGGTTGNEAIARDTVYAVVMIVLNGIMGLCLVVGATRHREQAFQVQGAAAILSVIATLAVVNLVLPAFTKAEPGPKYSVTQLAFVGGVSLVLYLVFIFVQTVRHRTDFVMTDGTAHHGSKPGPLVTAASAVLMVGGLAVVILLAKALSPSVEAAVRIANLPVAVVGLVIAVVILLPEGLTAVRAAANNRLQTSLNASLGSALASIGLTFPIVGAVSLLTGHEPILGLEQSDMVLLLLTLFIATLSLATGRTTVLQGAVHLVLFGIYLLLAAEP